MSGQEEFVFDIAPARDPVDDNRPLPKWLGLVTNHRRLFDAGQDGWLRPPPGSCFVLGRESFVSEAFPGGRNAIPVRLAFDVDKLPFPDALTDLKRGGTGDDPRAVRWRAPIPLFAVKTMETPSVEQKNRLMGMVDQLANVSLPDTQLAVNDFAVTSPREEGPSTPDAEPLELPESLNAIQGAMAMAVWAVPHVEPWVEALRHALDRDAAGVAEGIAKLDADWLQLPWLVREPPGPLLDDEDEQSRLWQAALRCMERSTVQDLSPGALAKRIAREAEIDGKNPAAKIWLDRTLRLVAAEETISCDDWRENGAGLAIRLALLRPDPTRFRSWNKDLPGVPPGVWWAAAILCGWHRGYRALDNEFRGDAGLQELVAIRALEASWPGGGEGALPPSQRSPLERTRQEGRFILTWRGEPVLRKEWKARARWYAADLTDDDADRAARDLAGRLGWPCVERRLFLPEGRTRAEGGGRWYVDGDDLVVEGTKSLRLPKSVDVHERLDPDEFRRRLATEAGVVSDPLAAYPRPAEIEAGAVMDPADAFRPPAASGDVADTDPPRVDDPRYASDPPGLIYRPDFVTEEEEARLLERIDGAEWSTELKRRVQQYGWRYDYKKRRIDEATRVPDLPPWARELAVRLVSEGMMTELSDQLIVNEYLGNQGITPHIDQPDDFAEHIATISLLETWGMVFQRRREKQKIEKLLERRSVAVLSGEARYEWTHEIRQRKSDPPVGGKGKRVPRDRRISLTFRKTRLHRSD